MWPTESQPDADATATDIEYVDEREPAEKLGDAAEAFSEGLDRMLDTIGPF